MAVGAAVEIEAHHPREERFDGLGRCRQRRGAYQVPGRQRAKCSARWRLARSPKWRMRMKPLGRTCRSKRRMNCSVPMGFPAKVHRCILQAHQALVADGHPMGVAAKVGDDLFRAGERALGIDHPIVGTYESEELVQRLGLGECGKAPGKAKLSLLEGVA